MASRYARACIVVLIAALAVLLGGCFGGGHAVGSPEHPTIPVGKSSQSIEWAGTTRTFHVYRPQGLSDAAPLVVMLHGGFGSGAQAESSYRWDTEADKGHFLVAYPDGQGRAWNAGSCCGNPSETNLDDVGFIGAVVDAIKGQTPVDAARVYVTGMSNGAMMALRMACETDLFAAIAPVAGTLVTDCSRARPTSVLQIHGTADASVPYNGGPGKALKINGTPRVDGLPVPTVTAAWRAIDSCAAPTSTTAGAVTTETAVCPQGRTVELISVADAGHQWPGGVRGPVLERLGLPQPSTALDATDTIWQFFSQHHR
ncbi:alpha/beta hydrolase family esterase [Mycobacterium gordonae]|uniref:Polyhydroxybutyrate depolymerase n=1 Tax=Mycobacterium gordonae TaxID=1778 RepID=A0A1A6BLH6_MYCGO|nr:PHB depolymerase family esterase [Mycobacterium gordonae]MBI2697881.1 prolyl oligopeptidase family serine peptidase [Mycobacterium sp.]MCQ4362053.1 prolyl oligopeptidase family serine peptidase [Mycobacterium gordonae]MCV7006260.1 prolyl oligopeptidase family serine peptidase [Mycobacterium gordonae]OBS03069.1 polyhydroxybutyrate depolymerase [Mycobacterium gordonae]ODR19454.1 polyhydroxybutyrate depolymerase [Mycobacterium gordonae]